MYRHLYHCVLHCYLLMFVAFRLFPLMFVVFLLVESLPLDLNPVLVVF